MTLTQIRNRVSKENGFDVAIKKRDRKYAYAKKVYCKLAHQFNKYTYQDIADSIDCNHATIIHHLKTFDSVYDADLDNYIKLKKEIQPLHQKEIFIYRINEILKGLKLEEVESIYNKMQ